MPSFILQFRSQSASIQCCTLSKLLSLSQIVEFTTLNVFCRLTRTGASVWLAAKQFHNKVQSQIGKLLQQGDATKFIHFTVTNHLLHSVFRVLSISGSLRRNIFLFHFSNRLRTSGFHLSWKVTTLRASSYELVWSPGGAIKRRRGLGRFPRSRLTSKSFVKFYFSNLALELVSGSLAVSHLGNRSKISRINPRRNSSRSTGLMLRGPKFGRIEGESHKIVSRKIARR